MHPRQAALLAQADELTSRLAKKKTTEKKQQAGGKSAVPVLWKYTDPDTGKSFYLSERESSPVKSPWSGKSLTKRPQKSPLGDVTKELKADPDEASAKTASWGDDD